MSADSQSRLEDYSRKIDCPAGCGERIYPSQMPVHYGVCEALDSEVHY